MKTTGSVLIVVIMMGPGFSSLGGKKCIKNKSLEKARPHKYSIGGRVDKSYRLPRSCLFPKLLPPDFSNHLNESIG